MIKDDQHDDILSESDRLNAEAHVAVARSLIVLEEVRALRAKADDDPDAVFSAVAERQLARIDAPPEPEDEPPGAAAKPR